MSAYKKLESTFAEIQQLSNAQAMLHWDMAAMMPSGGGQARGDTLATLAVLSHRLLTADGMQDDLRAAEHENLNDWQQANLKEMSRSFTMASVLPADLVEALSKAASDCEMQWRQARKDKDYKAVLPALKTIFDLTRKEAQILSDVLDLTPYDALLNKFEPGGRAEKIDPIFASYAVFLPEFLGQVLDRQASAPAAVLPDGPFPIEQQKALGQAVMEKIGFDFNHGRLDVSAHPFCGGIPQDVRITTRYDEADFTTALMGVIHETGHAMYERGLPQAWQNQPVGHARGMVMHESQSLLMEMQACRSPEFIGFLSQLAQQTFQAEGPAWSAENLQRLYTKVEPGLIRVDADEVTYPAHVILRYELEKALLSEDLKLEDLPTAWNDGLEKLIGVRPENDAEGCMQDIHWYSGAIGYFPTYSLGAMSAAQLFASAKDQITGLMDQLAKGDFSSLLAWLGKNVHQRASSQSTDEIMKGATGKALDPEVFKAHLRSRYLP